MTSIYDALRDYTRRKIDRREFLKHAVAAGLATPAVLAYLEGSASAMGAGVERSQKSGLTPFSQAAAPSDPLVFNAWSFKPEVVEAFQREFEKQYDESVHFEVMPGSYTTIMLNKMIANAPLDCLYTTEEGTKMLEAGWIHDLSDLPNIDEIKAATLPAQWQAQTYKGMVFGLPYFNSMKCCLAYNRLVTEKAGLTESDLPATWDEAYDICRRLKKDGVAERTMVMWWNKSISSVVDNFVAECLSRGEMLWDEEFNAIFDENTAVADTLNAWQSIWKDGLVPPDCMAGGNPLEIFGPGETPFSVIQSYQLKDLNDPENYAMAGNVMMVPYKGQAWGLLDYGLYSIASRPKEDVERLERRKNWVTFMGYKDANGEYLVAKEWVKQAALGTGYPEVYELPDVIDAFKSWMPEYPLLREIMAENEKHVATALGWHAVWFPEWGVKAMEVLPQVITGDMGVTDGVKVLRQEWDSLQQRYSR